MAGVAGRYWLLVIGYWESRQRRLFKKESVAVQRHPKLFTFHFSLSGSQPEPPFTIHHSSFISAWSIAPC
jgi:hypothetical protein